MRRSLGTAVFSGMLGVTFFGIFLTPVFYYVLRGLNPEPLKLHPGSTPGKQNPPAQRKKREQKNWAQKHLRKPAIEAGNQGKPIPGFNSGPDRPGSLPGSARPVFSLRSRMIFLIWAWVSLLREPYTAIMKSFFGFLIPGLTALLGVAALFTWSNTLPRRICAFGSRAGRVLREGKTDGIENAPPQLIKGNGQPAPLLGSWPCFDAGDRTNVARGQASLARQCPRRALGFSGPFPWVKAMRSRHPRRPGLRPRL